MRLNSLYVAMIATCAGTAFAVPNNEVEPNDTKAAATPANSGGAGMANGDTIEGATTGTTTTGTGVLTSADYYRVKTAAAPLGIYRHRLSLTNTQGVNAYTATIRGLNQTGTAAAGGTAGTTDSTFQTGTTSTTTPARFVQWYGFGKQEEIYYRVTGGTTTTGTYTATLIDEAVTPLVVAQPIQPGLVTLGNATTNTTDTSWVLYDANFNAITNAEDSGLTGQTLAAVRAVNLTSGTYYVAYSTYRTASSQVTPAAPGETFWTGPLLDFPNAVANSSTGTAASLAFRITDAAGTTAVAASKPGAFDVQFIQFTVAAVQTNPAVTASIAPGTVLNDGTGSAVVTATVNPGQNPTSTGLSVSLDAALVGGGTVTLLDNGAAPDVTAGDNIFTGTVTAANNSAVGTFSLPITVTDAESRTGTTSVSLTTREPLGACCAPTGCTIITLSACTTAGGTFLGDGSICDQPGNYTAAVTATALEDISTTGTALAAAPGDDAVFNVTLPFNFTFYENSYGSVAVSTNGNLQFVAAGSTAFTNGDLPSVAVPNNAIYACWDDFNFNINTTDGLYSQTLGTAGVDLRHIIQWDKLAQFGAVADTEFNTFQVVLFESGAFEVRYGTMAPAIFAANDSTVGTENSAGTVAYQYDESTITSNSTLRFVYVPGASNCPTAPACLADIAGGGDNGDQPDGTVDGSDFIAFINSFGIGDATVDSKADIVDGGGVPPGDGTIDGSDFIAFINAFGAGC
jgi:hypothetical protein